MTSSLSRISSPGGAAQGVSASVGTVVGRVHSSASTERRSFREVLSSVSETSEAMASSNTPVLTGLIQELHTFTQEWGAAEKRITNLLPTLPKELREMVILQRDLHQLQVQSELFARAADGVSNTVRRLQQMGNG